MVIRIHNNDNSDYIDYEADTIEEIKELCKDRIKLANWAEGWSEVIKD
jgi:hypothetical protein